MKNTMLSFALAGLVAVMCAPSAQAEHHQAVHLDEQVAVQAVPFTHSVALINNHTLLANSIAVTSNYEQLAMADCPGCDQSYRVNNMVEAGCPGCDQSYPVNSYTEAGFAYSRLYMVLLASLFLVLLGYRYQGQRKSSQPFQLLR